MSLLIFCLHFSTSGKGYPSKHGEKDKGSNKKILSWRPAWLLVSLLPIPPLIQSRASTPAACPVPPVSPRSDLPRFTACPAGRLRWLRSSLENQGQQGVSARKKNSTIKQISRNSRGHTLLHARRNLSNARNRNRLFLIHCRTMTTVAFRKNNARILAYELIANMIGEIGNLAERIEEIGNKGE